MFADCDGEELVLLGSAESKVQIRLSDHSVDYSSFGRIVF